MPTDVYEKICDDHEALVLRYQEAEAHFREGFSLQLSTEEFRGRNQARMESFQALQDFEATLPPGGIDIAYKRTNRTNYRKEPDKSPFAKSSDPARIAKTVIQDYFLSMRGQDLQVETKVEELKVTLSFAHEGKEKMAFSFAAVLDKKKDPPKSELILFAQWRLPKDIAQKAAPPGMDIEEDRVYIQPLARQPADQDIIEAMFDWIGVDLMENHLQNPIPEWGSVKQGMHEGIKQLKYDPDTLAKMVPELSPYLT